MEHYFILKPSIWLGEGKIQLNMSEEDLLFCTRWNVAQKDRKGRIECFQEIQVKGLSEIMHNQFLFFDLGPGNFSLELDNPHLGKVVGRGLITEKVIAWEFRSSEMGFEGFEMYERQADDVYLLHAEYATTDQLRTVIRGKVWQENSSKRSS
jgi:hypothetical protein